MRHLQQYVGGRWRVWQGIFQTLQSSYEFGGIKMVISTVVVGSARMVGEEGVEF